MRGEDPEPVCDEGRRGRITPACAGKTTQSCVGQLIYQDHPRMRGEDLKTVGSFLWKTGSPPHARGRLVEGLLHLNGRGITPACAGKTRRIFRR